MIKSNLTAVASLFFKGSQRVRQLAKDPQATSTAATSLIMAVTMVITLSVASCMGLPVYAEKPQSPCVQALGKSPLQFDPITGEAEIRVFATPKNQKQNLINKAVTQVGKTFFGLNKLEQTSLRLRQIPKNEAPYFLRLTTALNFDLQFSNDDLQRIPRNGPLVIFSNHSINGADLLSLAAMVSKVREDVKIVMTDALDGVPEMRSNALFIDTSSRGGGLKLIQDAAAHLSAGKALIIAPSGEVSENKDGWIIDPPWKPGLLSIIENTHREDIVLLPAFVEGQAGAGYQTARKLWKYTDYLKDLHQALVEKTTQEAKDFKKNLDDKKISQHDYDQRMRQIEQQLAQSKAKINASKGIASYSTGLFNMKEIARHIGTTIDLSVGPAVELKTLAKLKEIDPDPKTYKLTQASYLRTRSLLQQKDSQPKAQAKKPQPIIAPVPTELIHSDFRKAEVEVLYDTEPSSTDSGVQVYFAQGKDIPNVMHELGRLREITFRKEGEGSGLSCDIDTFDEYYHHLIAYDKEKKQIMGAYRVGFLGDIIKQHGLRGAYFTQFVNASPELIAMLPTIIELGRSFLTEEYQGHPAGLDSLFTGIAKLLIKRPEYVDLMGVVSISDKYSKNSLNAMIQFLKKHHSHDKQLATAKNPPDLRSPITQAEWDLLLKVHAPDKNSFKGLNQLVGIIEKDEKIKMPDLVGIYPRSFQAKFITFNYDADFKATDGLILVHTPDIGLKFLTHFMKDQEAAKAHLERHK